MSLDSWKEEFYRTPAVVASQGTWKECLEHSLTKWEGLREENKAKHDVEGTREIYETTLEPYYLSIDSHSCALCQKAVRLEYDNDSEDEYCVNCPLYKHLGYRCDAPDAPFARYVMEDNPKPMVKALKAALEKVLNND